jgi:hypothetical protein
MNIGRAAGALGILRPTGLEDEFGRVREGVDAFSGNRPPLVGIVRDASGDHCADHALVQLQSEVPGNAKVRAIVVATGEVSVIVV